MDNMEVRTKTNRLILCHFVGEAELAMHICMMKYRFCNYVHRRTKKEQIENIVKSLFFTIFTLQMICIL